jgi:site-specific DNA recombinase
MPLDGQKADLARVERRTRKLVELITDDDAPVKALKEELRLLEARQAGLEWAVAVATAPAPLIHPNLAEVYRQKVTAMHEALHDASSRDEAFDVICSLIDEIRLVPVEGELRIEIKGELAGILELCDARANQKPGGLSTAGLAEQIKMVAGARNHLVLLLLARSASRPEVVRFDSYQDRHSRAGMIHHGKREEVCHGGCDCASRRLRRPGIAAAASVCG